MSVSFAVLRLIWIGVCAVAMLTLSRYTDGVVYAKGWLDGFLAGATVFAYGYRHPERWLRYTAWATGMAGGICFLFLPWSVQLAVIAPGIVWLWYDNFSSGLRYHLIAKPLSVSLVWAYSTFLLVFPFPNWAGYTGLFATRAIFILALALLYDVMDAEYDRRRGLTTLAGRLGIRTTMRWVKWLFGVAALISAVTYLTGGCSGQKMAGLVLSMAVSAVAGPWIVQLPLSLANRKALIDGLMVVQLFFVWAFYFLFN